MKAAEGELAEVYPSRIPQEVQGRGGYVTTEGQGFKRGTLSKEEARRGCMSNILEGLGDLCLDDSRTW